MKKANFGVLLVLLSSINLNILSNEDQIEVIEGGELILSGKPIYPERAINRGSEGFVDVKFTIDEFGGVSDITAKGYCGPCSLIDNNCATGYPGDHDWRYEFRECSIFNNSSVRTISKFQFNPKKVNEKPVTVENANYRFIFVLDD